MVDSSRTQLASKFLGYKTIYALSFVYDISTIAMLKPGKILSTAAAAASEAATAAALL